MIETAIIAGMKVCYVVSDAMVRKFCRVARKVTNPTLGFTIVAVLASCLFVSADDCQETFIVDETEYSVPDCWCGGALDSTETADVTKLARLPDEFSYEDYRIYVRPEVKAAFVTMAEAAKRDSIDLIVDSGYRSAAYQNRIIMRRLEAGQSIEAILTMVAPPGYSEHETGRALDLAPSEAAFAVSRAYEWMQKYAADFGFHETHRDSLTECMSREPWHWFYVPADGQ